MYAFYMHKVAFGMMQILSMNMIQRTNIRLHLMFPWYRHHPMLHLLPRHLMLMFLISSQWLRQWTVSMLCTIWCLMSLTKHLIFWMLLTPLSLMVRGRHPVGNPKRKVWWAQQQVSLSYETKVYQTSRRKNQLPKVDASWLGDSSR
jgi:hypothetical protein